MVGIEEADVMSETKIRYYGAMENQLMRENMRLMDKITRAHARVEEALKVVPERGVFGGTITAHLLTLRSILAEVPEEGI